MPLRLESGLGHWDLVITPLLRGVIFGLIGVGALAAWAVNMEIMVSASDKLGPLSWGVRILLCDVVPILTVLTIFRALESNRTAESTARGLLQKLFWQPSKLTDKSLDLSP